MKEDKILVVNNYNAGTVNIFEYKESVHGDMEKFFEENEYGLTEDNCHWIVIESENLIYH